MRPKQFVRAHSMKQEFLIIHTQWVRMSKKNGTGNAFILYDEYSSFFQSLPLNRPYYFFICPGAVKKEFSFHLFKRIPNYE